MSDISDLHGVYPPSLRWNAEIGILAISAFDAETGERGLVEIKLGKSATFIVDLATRSRGYGLIKSGVFDMQLTPVGSPAPSWPGDEYKPAVGMWAWHPTYGEVRIETNAATFMQALVNEWDQCRTSSEARAGKQPVVRFVDRVSVTKKAIGKSFFSLVIEVAGWVPRDQVPGWREREPTVLPPAELPILPAPSAPVPVAPGAKKPAKVRKAAAKPGPNDPLADLGDDIPRK